MPLFSNLLQGNSLAQCILERYTKHDHESAIMSIKIYTFSNFTPAEGIHILEFSVLVNLEGT